MRIRYCVVIAFVMQLTAGMGSGQISGPVLGYTKRGMDLRAVLGIPGAAYFGAPADVAGLEVAAVSSKNSYAAVLTADRKGVRLIPLNAGAFASVTIHNDLRTTVTAVRLSPNGTAAAIVSDNAIAIVTQLPSQPVVTKQIPKSEDLRTIAVSDDGQAVAVVDRFGAGRLLRGESSQQIPASDIRDIEFRSGTHDFLYIDADVVSVTSGGVSTMLAGTADGVSAPRLARLSHNGQSFFVLNANTQDLLIGKNPGGVFARVSLPCQASDLEWVHDLTLKVSCEPDGAVHLIQLSETGVRLLFVPEPVE